VKNHKHWLLSQAASSGTIVLVHGDDNTDERRAAAEELADEGLIEVLRSGVFELRYRLTPRGVNDRTPTA
jgi:hypothetical protein